MKRIWDFISALTAYRLEPMVFLYSLGGSLVYATLQNLMLERVCSVNLGYNQSVCDNITELSVQENRVQTLANKYLLYQNLIQGVPGVFFTLLAGPISDAFGRKLILLPAMVSSVVSIVIYIIIASYPTIPAHFLILAALPGVLAGGPTIFLLAVFSCLGDTSDARSRTSRTSLLDFFYFSPVAVAFAGSGWLLRHCGYAGVYTLSLVLSSMALFWAVFLLPESHPRSSTVTVKSVLREANPTRLWNTISRRRPGSNRSIIVLGIIGYIIQQMTWSGVDVVNLPYVKKVFHWTYDQYTHFACVVVVVCLIFNVAVLPWLSYGLSVRDSPLALISIACWICGLLVRSMADSATLFCLGAAIGLPGLMVAITLRSLVSKCVSSREMAAVFSLMASAEALSGMITSLIFLLLYNTFLHSDPARIYLVTAAMALPVLLVVIVCALREFTGDVEYTIFADVDAVVDPEDPRTDGSGSQTP